MSCLVGNLQLSVGKLQLCAPRIFLTHDAAVCRSRSCVKKQPIKLLSISLLGIDIIYSVYIVSKLQLTLCPEPKYQCTEGRVY